MSSHPPRPGLAWRTTSIHRKVLHEVAIRGHRNSNNLNPIVGTCGSPGVEPFDYLIKLLKHPEDIKREPGRWLPRTYPALTGEAQ